MTGKRSPIDAIQLLWKKWRWTVPALLVLLILLGLVALFAYILFHNMVYSAQMLKQGSVFKPQTWPQLFVYYTGPVFVDILRQDHLTTGQRVYVIFVSTGTGVAIAVIRILRSKIAAIAELVIAYNVIWVALSFELTNNFDVNGALVFGGIFLIADALTVLLPGKPIELIKRLWQKDETK